MIDKVKYYKEYYQNNKERYRASSRKAYHKRRSLFSQLSDLKVDNSPSSLNELSEVKKYLSSFLNELKNVLSDNLNELNIILNNTLNELKNHLNKNEIISELKNHLNLNLEKNKEVFVTKSDEDLLKKETILPLQKDLNLVQKKVKKISLQVEFDLLNEINSSGLAFNQIFFRCLNAFKDNKFQLNAIPLKHKIRRDVKMSLDYSEIYKTIPEKNKMFFVNGLLSRYKEIIA